MARFQKVVWYEGMKLDPHHFQQSDRFHQHALHSRTRTIAQHYWGFTELEVDNEALTNGQIGIIKCKATMPDGMVVNMPEVDHLPQARSFEEIFAATSEKLDVYLAVRSEKEIGSNCYLPDETGNKDTRFKLENIEVMDDNSGVDPRSVGVAGANFQFLCTGEPLDDFTSLKIAEIKRTQTGSYELNADFTPPCLSLSASENLVKLARDTLTLLNTASGNYRSQAPYNKNALSASDYEILSYLQTVNGFIPLINHYYMNPASHPEALYCVLLSLAGELSAYSNGIDTRPAEFPQYQHNNLASCYQRIITIIKQLLAEVGPAPDLFFKIPLQKQGDFLYTGKFDDETQLDLQLYLAVSSELPEQTIIDGLASNIKIGALEEIHAIHGAGLQGMVTRYVPNPPTNLPDRQNKFYFKIEKDERFWSSVVDSKNIAILTAEGFTAITIELIALKEQ